MLLCPWDSPGKKTEVGGHSLLQGIFPTEGLNPGLLHCKWILYHWAGVWVLGFFPPCSIGSVTGPAALETVVRLRNQIVAPPLPCETTNPWPSHNRTQRTLWQAGTGSEDTGKDTACPLLYSLPPHIQTIANSKWIQPTGKDILSVLAPRSQQVRKVWPSERKPSWQYLLHPPFQPKVSRKTALQQVPTGSGSPPTCRDSWHHGSPASVQKWAEPFPTGQWDWLREVGHGEAAGSPAPIHLGHQTTWPRGAGLPVPRFTTTLSPTLQPFRGHASIPPAPLRLRGLWGGALGVPRVLWEMNLNPHLGAMRQCMLVPYSPGSVYLSPPSETRQICCRAQG